jgi:arylsulfatase A-like enzyme
MNVPWMVIGPGIKKGHEIQGEVKVEDTAPTIMRMLGIESHECWTAKTIDEIFE